MKTVLITGANSGIGKATATELAMRGYHVIMLCRNKDKGDVAKQEISQKTANKNIDLMIADLSSLASIRQFAKEFDQKFEKLDVLINNAAVNLFTRQVTEEGLETSFATNHLGHFLLTNLLLPKLKAANGSRIINVASSAQAVLDFDDLMSEKTYNVMRVYSKTKMANILFTYELARRLNGTGITVNCLHPGVVKTNLARDARGIFRVLMFLFYPFFSSPEKAAQTSVFLATSPDVEGISGRYFHKKKQIRSSAQSYDENIAKRLWMVSEQLTHLV
jgi:NAD(P)-dependent dehydrogenase (short-subunit alcohol dehydrogenase family)